MRLLRPLRPLIMRARGLSSPAYERHVDIENFSLLPHKYRRGNHEAMRRYELKDVIGRGKTAVVKRGVNLDSGESVAIKVLSKYNQRALIEQELSILEEVTASIDNDCLSPVLDVFEDDHNMYMVLELFEGGELFDMVVERGALPEAEVAVMMRKLMHALDALHRHNIIHRDIKPENILLDDSANAAGSVAIADFGMAQKLGVKDHISSTAGTLGYAAPEVLQERDYTTACDIWSAGVVAYVLLAGFPPFPLAEEEEETAAPRRTLSQQVGAELEAILHGREERNWAEAMRAPPFDAISFEAKELLARMLEIDPGRRYTSRQVLHSRWIRRHIRGRRYEYLNFE